MRRIGTWILIVIAGALTADVLASAAGGGPLLLAGPLQAVLWGAVAVGVAVRLLRAVLGGRSVRRALAPLADAGAVYNELLTSTSPAAAQVRELRTPSPATLPPVLTEQHPRSGSEHP